MRAIDLNADIGEADNPEWTASEARIMTVVTSANIACGGHAGDAETMRITLRAAKANNVNVGAHPAYPDRESFGRRSLTLGGDISAEDLKETLRTQILSLMDIAAEEGVSVNYVKPHGALYNDAVADQQKAELITEVIGSIDPKLTLLGGPNSEMLKAGKAVNLNFVAEGFIDRRYTDDGHLLSRAVPGAVLASDAARIDQAVSLATDKTVITHTGKTLIIEARSLCLHGDSEGAVETAIQAKLALQRTGISIQPFLSPFVQKASA